MSSPVTTRARWMHMKRKRSVSTQEEPSPSKIPKACWNDFTTRALLELLIEEIHAGNRVNGNINSDGWRNIVSNFRLRTGQSYNKVQLRNRAAFMRKLYGKWRKINDRATGLGVDPRTGAIQAPDEWWDDVAHGDPEILKWKTAPPKFLDLMDECFSGNVATGADTYYPSYCRGGGTFRPPPRMGPPAMPPGQVPYMGWGTPEFTASNFCPPRGESPSCGDGTRTKRTRAGTSKPSTGERMASSMEEYVGEQKKKNALLERAITGSEEMSEFDHAMSLVNMVEGIHKNTTLYLHICKVMQVRMQRHVFVNYVSELDHERQMEWFKRFL